MSVRLLLLIGLILSLALPVCAFAETVNARDRNGRLVRVEKPNAHTTIVRDPSGRIIEKRIRRGNRVEIRNANGFLLRTETVK
jgi:YD repeat-containing protein